MLTDLRQIFPNLASLPYRRTSSPTQQYNCIAWAMNDDTKWWEPDPLGWMYWPNGSARVATLSSVMAMFRNLGYSNCASAALESDYEKIAVYTEGNRFTHVARQLADGKWTSKLGDLDDITHSTLDALAGQAYGKPAHFLRRQITLSAASATIASWQPWPPFLDAYQLSNCARAPRLPSAPSPQPPHPFHRPPHRERARSRCPPSACRAGRDRAAGGCVSSSC